MAVSAENLEIRNTIISDYSNNSKKIGGLHSIDSKNIILDNTTF